MIEMECEVLYSIWDDLSHDFEEFNITTLDGCGSLVLTMCNLESMMY